MTDARNLSLLSLAREISSDAGEIARLTTSTCAQELALEIQKLAQQLIDDADLDTPACSCPVCAGKPQRVGLDPVCDTARCDALAAFPKHQPTTDEVLEKLTADAWENLEAMVLS